MQVFRDRYVEQLVISSEGTYFLARCIGRVSALIRNRAQTAKEIALFVIVSVIVGFVQRCTCPVEVIAAEMHLMQSLVEWSTDAFLDKEMVGVYIAFNEWLERELSNCATSLEPAIHSRLQADFAVLTACFSLHSLLYDYFCRCFDLTCETCGQRVAEKAGMKIPKKY
jgi:hypothetical protein